MDTPSVKNRAKRQCQIGSIGIHCVQGAACFATRKSVHPSPIFKYHSAFQWILTLMLGVGIPLVFWPNVLKNEYSTKSMQ